MPGLQSNANWSLRHEVEAVVLWNIFRSLVEGPLQGVYDARAQEINFYVSCIDHEWAEWWTPAMYDWGPVLETCRTVLGIPRWVHLDIDAYTVDRQNFFNPRNTYWIMYAKAGYRSPNVTIEIAGPCARYPDDWLEWAFYYDFCCDLFGEKNVKILSNDYTAGAWYASVFQNLPMSSWEDIVEYGWWE
jgi:hypothetical protein